MPLDYLAHLRADGAALSVAAHAGSLTAGVPSCPEWDVSALLVHTSRVHRWAADAVLGGGERPGRMAKPPEDVATWFDDGLANLLAALEATPATAPAWSFFDPAGSVAFWQRRMAQETTVHRWDAEVARGMPATIDASLATDGIDEALDLFARRRIAQTDHGVDTGGSLHVHCTDVEGEWTFQATGQSFELTRGHSKGDVAVRGSAEALLLLLWGRTALETAAVEVFGDETVLHRWLAGDKP